MRGSLVNGSQHSYWPTSQRCSAVLLLTLRLAARALSCCLRAAMAPVRRWMCRCCELRDSSQRPPQCCLCPVVGGALKPTVMDGRWCHAACMQWIPEVTTSDFARMEPIEGIENIQKERWELTCCVCK